MRTEEIALGVTLAPQTTEMPFVAGVRLIEVELAATGFAQVIAVLRPEPVYGDAAALSVSALIPGSPKQFDWATDLTRHFTVPSTSQAAMLNLSRMISGTRASLGFQGREKSEARTVAHTEVPKARVYPHLGVVLGTIDQAGFAGLASDQRVRDVQLAPQVSLIRPTRTAAASKGSGISWAVERIGAPALWAAGFDGTGVLIGHLDTGVDPSHPALSGAVAAFAEFDVLGKQVRAKPHDTGSHGTHTAGTLVGRKVGQARFGVAPGATLASAIVIEGGDLVARILGGMDWAIAQGVRILNMSLGLRGNTPAFLSLTQQLRLRGVLPVFAIGNEGPGTSRMPGNYAEALSVGASDKRDRVDDDSGSQRFARPNDPLVPDLVAPGVDILSCLPGGKYGEMAGTSMAAPHVAGLAALLLQAVPGATVDDLEKAILDSCALPAGMLPERANRGVPDGPRAYQSLTGSALPILAALSTTIRKSGPGQPKRRKVKGKAAAPAGPSAKSRSAKKKGARSGRAARDRQRKGRAARRDRR